ncbi:hypothetical protein Dsin_005334, partial [Dipteronia sinensis]
EIYSGNDEIIDLQEFFELNTKGVDSNEVIENLKDAFSLYDIDSNRSITVEELHKVFKSLGEDCTVAECMKMINVIDNDDNVKSRSLSGQNSSYGQMTRIWAKVKWDLYRSTSSPNYFNPIGSCISSKKKVVGRGDCGSVQVPEPTVSVP